MRPKSENNSFALPLWWSGVFLCILGAVTIQFAGFTFSSFQQPEFSGQKERETLTAVLADPLPASRQLRSTRNRTGAHGRLHNFRSGGDGNSTVLWTETHPGSFTHSDGKIFLTFSNAKNLWTDFIISALPVRAGPAA